jgi:CBS-domain-containing membrane protein
MIDQMMRVLGVETVNVSHAERLVSAIGATAGIAAVLAVSSHLVGVQGAALLVASMGASAVLLFAVPHGSLAQPWPFAAGHVISAAVGVACAKLIASPWLAAPLAVGLAVALMYFLRCIHPPGGATALTAVMGGADIHALGFQFVLTPVLVNVAVMLIVALAFNNFFPWRRYPAALNRRGADAQPVPASGAPAHIAHEDFVYALSQIDSFIDVTEDDLLRIYALATSRAGAANNPPA